MSLEYFPRPCAIEEMASYHLLLKEYWLSVTLVPHRHSVCELTGIVTISSLGASARKKGAGTTQNFMGTCLREPEQDLDVRIKGSASGRGGRWWTWFFYLVLSPFPHCSLQFLPHFCLLSGLSMHWLRVEQPPVLRKLWLCSFPWRVNTIYLLRSNQYQINTGNIRGQISTVKNRPALLLKDCTMLPVQCVVLLVFCKNSLPEVVTEAHVLLISLG